MLRRQGSRIPSQWPQRKGAKVLQGLWAPGEEAPGPGNAAQWDLSNELRKGTEGSPARGMAPSAKVAQRQPELRTLPRVRDTEGGGSYEV